MRHKKLFIGIVALISVWIAGCSEDTDDAPSKTTTIDEIVLRAYHYPDNEYWPGGWESSWQDEDLLLSNLLPSGQIKNNTKYEVTIAATLEFLPIKVENTKSNEVHENIYEKMEAFQYVFTKPGADIIDRWIDLVDDPYPLTKENCTPITAGPISITGTLTTNPDAADNFEDSVLALTNACNVPAVEWSAAAAKFTNVVITITEK